MNAWSLDLGAEQQELAAIAAESIGWLPLGQGAYLHHGDADGEQNVIHVVGGRARCQHGRDECAAVGVRVLQ